MHAYDNLANACSLSYIYIGCHSILLKFINLPQTSIMCHSAIVGSVRRLTEGATENNDICRMSLKFANRSKILLKLS